MIRHVVLFSATAPGHVETILETLRGYAEIPGVQALEVGRNRKSDPLSTEIDVILTAIFTDEAALAAYKAHPIYLEGIAVIRPLREMRIAADFIVGAG